jgi:hypothetical protein
VAPATKTFMAVPFSFGCHEDETAGAPVTAATAGQGRYVATMIPLLSVFVSVSSNVAARPGR